MMSTFGNPGVVFLFISLCSAAAASAAPAQGCGTPVPLAEVTANPEAYHGQPLLVVAEVTVEFENMTACAPGKPGGKRSCLWLTIDDGPHTADQDYARYQAKLKIWQAYDLQTVAIRATFDKTSKGHFSMYPGSLRSVTQVLGHDGGWSFVTNAAVPHGACAAELRLPKQPEDQRAMISGNLKLRNNDVDGAIADFTRAISINPSVFRYYMVRAGAREKKRDYAGAIADYTRAIELAHEDRDVLYTVRAEAKEKAGDLDGAIADCTQAIMLKPGNPDGYLCRGRLRRMKGDLKGGAADMERARLPEPAKASP